MCNFVFDVSVLSDKVIEGINFAIEGNYLKDCKNVRIRYEIDQHHQYDVTKQTFTVYGVCEQGIDYLQTLAEELKRFMQIEYREPVDIDFW